MEFHHTTLPNGLEIVAETNPAAQSVAFGYFVRTGSRDETSDVHGVSHFLEHMAFKGTERFSASDVNRVFDELGADYNAATSEESTIFYAAVLPEYLPEAFEMQSAIIQPALRDDDFTTEKQVILEEIGMYDDQPSIVAYDAAMQLHFTGHPLGRTILGTQESIRALAADQMRSYHATHYRAGNIVLAAAGNVSWPVLQSLAERHCGAWPAGSCPREARPAQLRGGCRQITRDSLQVEQVVQMAPAPDANDPLRFAAELLTVIVGDDQNSRLFWEFVAPGLAEMAELSYHDFDDSGTYLFYLSCDPDAILENLQMTGRLFEAIQRDGVTDEELRLAKTKVATRIVLRGERPMGRLPSLGANWLARKEYRSIADDLAMVEAITQRELRELLEKFPLTMCTTVGVGPLESLK